jgi:hypothetical protein
LPRLGVQQLREHRKRQNAQRLALDEAWREHGFVFASTIGTPIEPRNINRAGTNSGDGRDSTV